MCGLPGQPGNPFREVRRAAPFKGHAYRPAPGGGAFAHVAKASGKKGPRTRLHAKTRKAQGFAGYDGTPGAVRTHGLQSRRQKFIIVNHLYYNDFILISSI